MEQYPSPEFKKKTIKNSVQFDEKNRNPPLKNGAMYANAFVGPNPLYCPITNSAKKTGSPIKNAAKRYGIRNAPPPFLYAK